MLPSLLLLAVSTLVGAVTLPFNKVESDFDSLGPRNLFNRQSKFQCSNGYFCDNSQICCGVYCCNPGYACSQYYTCEPSSSVSCTSTRISAVIENLLIKRIDMLIQPTKMWFNLLQ